MSYLKLLKSTAILAIAAVGATTAALGSPSSGTITSTTYVKADLDAGDHVNNDRIKFQTKGRTDVLVQKLEFAPGAYTGFHHHPGLVIVAVQSGSIALMNTSCGITNTYGAGSVFVEGDDHAHQAISEGGAVVYVTYVAPSADPVDVRDEDPLPLCAQEF